MKRLAERRAKSIAKHFLVRLTEVELNRIIEAREWTYGILRDEYNPQAMCLIGHAFSIKQPNLFATLDRDRYYKVHATANAAAHTFDRGMTLATSSDQVNFINRLKQLAKEELHGRALVENQARARDLQVLQEALNSANRNPLYWELEGAAR